MFQRLRFLPGLLLLTMLLFAAPLSAQPPATQPAAATRVLYRKPLPEGRELVVLLDPPVPAETMKGLLPPEALADKRLTGFTSLNVIVRSPAQPPLRLWSQWKALYGEAEYAEYQVLDLLQRPDLLVMVMAVPGSCLHVVRAGFAEESALTSLRGTDWSLLGAAVPAAPGRLAAKLSYDEKEKRVDIEVTDTLQDYQKRTWFQQKPGQWDFVAVKHVDKVPPTVAPGAPAVGGNRGNSPPAPRQPPGR